MRYFNFVSCITSTLKVMTPYNEGSFTSCKRAMRNLYTWHDYLSSYNPSDRAVRVRNFCSLDNVKVLGPGIEPAMLSSEAMRNLPTLTKGVSGGNLNWIGGVLKLYDLPV